MIEILGKRIIGSTDNFREYVVTTGYTLVTLVIDVRTGQELLRIDNSRNYRVPPMWNTPWGLASRAEVLFRL